MPSFNNHVSDGGIDNDRQELTPLFQFESSTESNVTSLSYPLSLLNDLDILDEEFYTEVYHQPILLCKCSVSEISNT